MDSFRLLVIHRLGVPVSGFIVCRFQLLVFRFGGYAIGAVILAAFGGSTLLLSRSVLYTAITRARELLIIVGREETVATMTENARRNRRYTGLKLRLQGKCG